MSLFPYLQGTMHASQLLDSFFRHYAYRTGRNVELVCMCSLEIQAGKMDCWGSRIPTDKYQQALVCPANNILAVQKE